MNELMTVREVAQTLRTCAKQVDLLAARGQFPQPVRIGRSKRWRRYEVESFIKRGCKMEQEAVA